MAMKLLLLMLPELFNELLLLLPEAAISGERVADVEQLELIGEADRGKNHRRAVAVSFLAWLGLFLHSGAAPTAVLPARQ